MSFLHPEFLYYMLPPLFILFGLLLTQKETQEHFFSQEVMDKLRVSANTLTIKARNALFLLMATFMIVALSEPVIKDAKVQVKAKSADIMIALDISDSMLATDMYPNRLELAKQKAITLLDSAPNERIGVVAFAKNSYLVSPLSFDSAAVSFLLRQLDTSSITEKGTDILSVLKVVNETQKDKEKKYLLLLTDGGDKSDFSKEIEMAKENGIVVFILGVATKKGAPVKKDNGEFIKYNGNIIVSKLNESISKLATETGGVYIQGVSSSNDINTMFKEILSIADEKELKSEEIQKYTPLFYYPLAMALFLLLIATSSMAKKSSIASIMFALVLLTTQDSNAGVLDFMDLKEAKQAYEKGEFEKSQKIYQNYAEKNAQGEAYFNAGNSLYKQKKYKEAIDSYKKATFDSKDLRAKNLANIANSYALQGKDKKNLQEAVKAYEESLKLLEDKETRENFEMVKKLLQKEKDKKKDKQENKDKKNQKQNKDQKQNSKDSKKKDSDENKEKSSDEKDKSKDEKDSSKSKKSEDKQKSDNDMKSKEEKNEESKSKEENKKKQDLKKLSEEDKKKQEQKDKKNAHGTKELDKDKMSEAEEKKWLKQLNMNKNTYMYKLNKEQNQYNQGDEKPW